MGRGWGGAAGGRARPELTGRPGPPGARRGAREARPGIQGTWYPCRHPRLGGHTGSAEILPAAGIFPALKNPQALTERNETLTGRKRGAGRRLFRRRGRRGLSEGGRPPRCPARGALAAAGAGQGYARPAGPGGRRPAAGPSALPAPRMPAWGAAGRGGGHPRAGAAESAARARRGRLGPGAQTHPPRGAAHLLLLRGQRRRHVGLGRGRRLHPAAAAAAARRAELAGSVGSAARPASAPESRASAAGRRLAHGRARGARRPQTPPPAKQQPRPAAPLGAEALPGFPRPSPCTSPALPGAEGGSAGQGLGVRRAREGKRETENFGGPGRRPAAETSRRPPASPASRLSAALRCPGTGAALGAPAPRPLRPVPQGRRGRAWARAGGARRPGPPRLH